MKIIELRLKNLNSLYGEWRIDFTDSDYENNGIFALTGPTGAGKSTVLDAICLALYGATPRLGRITASANDIMSRQTGECFAEVVFGSQAGVFRCRWEQRRARKSPTGNLQNQEHQIAEAHTGTLLESRVSRVAGVVEAKTGMDFERFTRSVLLAQGSFDTFLKADAEQKSKLLEQITGTEIYTTISLRAHERWREEKQKTVVLETELAGIGLLEAEEEQDIQKELNLQEHSLNLINTELNTVNKAVHWLESLRRLKQEIKNLKEKQLTLQTDADQFLPQRQRLDLANRAASLDGLYAELNTLKNQQETDQTERQTANEQLPKIQKNVVVLATQHQALIDSLTKAKQALHAARPLIETVRALDQQLPKPYKQLRHIPLMSVAVEQERLDGWLQGRLLREYEQEREALWREKVLLTKIASLEQERAQLQAARPCPLCGATEHPYAKGQVPAVDATEAKIEAINHLIEQVHICTENIKTAELSEKVAKRRDLYGDQDPSLQEQHLQEAVYAAEQAELQHREKHTALQQNLAVVQAKLEAVEQRLYQRQQQLSEQQQKMSEAIVQAGFINEAAFLAARLTPAQREGLAAQAQTIDNQLLSLQSRLEDRQTAFALEQSKSLSTDSLEQLLPKQQEQHLQLQQLQQSAAQLRYQLERNNEAKAHVHNKQIALEAQKKELHKWQRLHELIGSADGKKYRNFAQGLTFELMVQHANQQLEKMTDRYLLVRDAVQPLSLDVIDNYQAGERRSTKNLSGGESFIVSLSLALGLSKMASQTVRVDSLFLDEGFGTLDEDALDVALGTLANLQQEGKLIGVISHVSALKERIATQVRIITDQGGRSQIVGPGCSKI